MRRNEKEENEEVNTVGREGRKMVCRAEIRVFGYVRKDVKERKTQEI
jgi:hypothetical protein